MAKASTLPTISPDSWTPSEDHPDRRSRNIPKIPWEEGGEKGGKEEGKMRGGGRGERGG